MDFLLRLMNGNWATLELVIGAILVAAVLKEVLAPGRKRKRTRRRSTGMGGYRPRDSKAELNAFHAADQLKVVANSPFTARPLLNRSEAKVFEMLNQAVTVRNPCWHVMAQVSLGEFLASPDAEAFRAINSKRVDFALMDENCCVRHALEYQGSGHHAGSSAAARDAIKKEAMRKAGIGYHEVVAGQTTPGELRTLVEKLVPAALGGARKRDDLMRSIAVGD